LWQGCFGSVVMDEEHLRQCGAVCSLNPIRAGLAEQAQGWLWPSAAAHLSGSDGGLTTVAPVLARYENFAAFLDQEEDAALQGATPIRNNWVL